MRARRRQARSESRGLRDARVDDVYVQLIGPDVAVFFAAWEKDVLPFPHVTPSCWSSQPTSAAAPWRGAGSRTDLRQSHNMGGFEAAIPGYLGRRPFPVKPGLRSARAGGAARVRGRRTRRGRASMM